MMTRSAPIKNKIITLSMLVCSIVLLLASSAFIGYERYTFRNTLVDRVSLVADVLGKNSTAALAFHDQQTATETLSALRSDMHISAARIYNSAGAPFADYASSHRQGPPP